MQWSPEQSAGMVHLGHGCIYLNRYADMADDCVLNKDFRSQKSRRKRHLIEGDRHGQILKLPIFCIEYRMPVDGWECDNIFGAAHKQATMGQLDRKSGFSVLAKLCNKSVDVVGPDISVMIKLLNSLLKTLIVNNGNEFADLQTIDQTLGIHTYFADQICSWQRCYNSDFNGLAGQYTPKKWRMETVTYEELTMI